MRDEANDPAFPIAYEFDDARAEFHGITIRDYFAAKALAAMIRNQTNRYPEQEAELSYEYADAMLKAREK